LYELATGQHPFCANSEVGILHAIVAQAPVPPTRLNPEVPSPLDALIQHMLAKDSRLRPTALEVEATLTQRIGTLGQPRSIRVRVVFPGGGSDDPY
jgi:serine/threonine protein kinase